MLPRRPEPELMDSQEQVEAYANADFLDSDQAFVERLCRALDPAPSGGRLIDLGCGPAWISLMAARALPGWRVDALDAGANMLARAGRNLAAEPPEIRQRVRLLQRRLPCDDLESGYDAIISNSLLHHLPEPAVLWQSVRQAGRGGCYVQVMDLYRPDSETRLEWLVAEYAGDAPAVLRQDFANSLRAAWTPDAIAAQLRAAGLERLTVEPISDRHVQVSGRL